MTRNRNDRTKLGLVVALAAALSPAAVRAQAAPDPEPTNAGFTKDFGLEACDFSSRGENPYFILQPGYRLVYEGQEDGEHVLLIITVSDRTLRVGNVETRIVVERETHDGELAEVSRNYFAICKQTNSVFYFGEDVDNYENGKIENHNGSWRAGVSGAKPGLNMSGTILLGGRYFQEVAPGVALDRAEIVAQDATVATPLRTFRNVLKIRETTPLEPGAVEFKFYAAVVGLIKDDVLPLVQAGFAN
jgi:hypothetical protein